jgi:amino acid permease
MRRLLRVDATPNAKVARQGTRAMSTSILISGIRCLLTYLVIPIAGPAIHLAGSVGRPLSIALCFIAAFYSVRSMRRFWESNHRYRWAYSTFALIVIAYMTYGVVTDVAHLL